MRVLLIRHGRTMGNLEGRYVGRTDEPLLESEKTVLAASPYREFRPDAVYCSRMLRCRQTAEILFEEMGVVQTGTDRGVGARHMEDDAAELKNAETEGTERKKSEKKPLLQIRQGLEETDFGEFEYKNYEELNGDPAYQAWIDSGGRLAFPGGESGLDFRRRCCRAFEECIKDAGQQGMENIAFVVHGGTIMSIMEAYAEPKADFYSWQLQNGEGYLTEMIYDEKENLSLKIVG